MAAEEMHSVLVEHLLLGCLLLMLGLTIMAFGILSKVYELELETQLHHYKKYCSKRFLLKFDGSTKTRRSHMKQSLKLPSCFDTSLLVLWIMIFLD